MIKIFIIGDSTASFYEKERFPQMGWAQVFQVFFNKDKILIVNEALRGRSSKSFYEEGHWNNVKQALSPDDYVFIQFGHNDSKPEKERHTEPFTTYKDYLKIYINDSLEKKALPVLLTSIHRNVWTDDKIINTLGHYPEAMKQLAAELAIPLIDLNEKTRILFESMGRKRMNEIFLIFEKGKIKNYPEGIIDNAHLQENGAKEIARLASQGIRELNLPIKKYLKKSAGIYPMP